MVHSDVQVGGIFLVKDFMASTFNRTRNETYLFPLEQERNIFHVCSILYCILTGDHGNKSVVLGWGRNTTQAVNADHGPQQQEILGPQLAMFLHRPTISLSFLSPVFHGEANKIIK